jgi:hypothetical protein
MNMIRLAHLPGIFILICILAGCTNFASPADSCPVTEPLWLKPPKDAAIPDEPSFGYFYANEDRSIMASAWWADQEEDQLHATKEGVKMGWFRPAGAPLEITGKRTDAKAPPLQADIPATYPTRFQATGVYFPSEGCWEVTGTAGKSQLTFVVWVEP